MKFHKLFDHRWYTLFDVAPQAVIDLTIRDYQEKYKNAAVYIEYFTINHVLSSFIIEFNDDADEAEFILRESP